jgi:hypothetical protein
MIDRWLFYAKKTLNVDLIFKFVLILKNFKR